MILYGIPKLTTNVRLSGLILYPNISKPSAIRIVRYENVQLQAQLQLATLKLYNQVPTINFEV